MDKLLPDQALPPYKIIGNNYAEDHDNKIHSDEVAAQFGFKGGLVPGVGVYAYLTHPVVEMLGSEWLRQGAMTAKFLKPIYHGEEATVQGKVTSTAPLCIALELFDAEGILCAVGEASLPNNLPALNIENYPLQNLPVGDVRPVASNANLPVGKILGSLGWELNLAEIGSRFLTDIGATLPIFFGGQAVCHPAYYLAQANEILMANVKLGPWIHTGSRVQHYSLSSAGERLSMRGKVLESYERRGHEIVVLELGLFGEKGRPVAQIRHSAIVRLA